MATPPTLREQRGDVELHPADDEEERDEDAERDGRELGVEAGDLALLEHLARDHARPRTRRAAGPARARRPAARARTRARRSSARRAASSSRSSARRAAACARTTARRRAATPTARATKPSRISRVVDVLCVREDQRQQQDRPELADRARREQVGRRSACCSSPRVRQHRDQRADRGRGQRGAGVEQREHDPGGREHAADPVGDRQRQQPAHDREPQREPGDAAHVDLVAGEEEEHPEPEARRRTS